MTGADSRPASASRVALAAPLRGGCAAPSLAGSVRHGS